MQKDKLKSAEPVTELGQIPFALCEIIAALEDAGRKDQAAVAESILDLVISFPSLEMARLSLPDEARREIVTVIERHLNVQQSVALA